MNLRLAVLMGLAAGFAVCAAASPAVAQPDFNTNRWSENWAGSDLAYKDIDLGDSVALDLGADARWKQESIEAPRFGLTAQGDDSWLAQRIMAHANVRFDDDARIFFEIGVFDVIGKSAKSGNDENRFDLQQAFLDLNHSFGDHLNATLRMGRQEMTFTGDRFFDQGDTSNIRRHYDAVRLMLSHGDWRYDVFAGAPINNIDGVWDDDIVDGQDFMGIQAERRTDALTSRFFLIDLTRDSFALSGTTAEDHRQTLGAIIDGKAGAYAYEIEFVRQFGQHGALDVNAWGGALVIERGIEAAWSPTFGARLTYGSGDSDPLDGNQEAYAPPNPRGSWFSEGGFTSHSNLFEAAATAELTPHEDWTVTLRLAGLWRPETADYVYASPHVALPGTRGGDAFIGVQPYAQITWRAGRHVQLRSHLAYVDVSDRIEAAGGEDASYANISLALRY